MREGISVITVNWNTKDLLLDCIDSVYRSMDDLPFEIWVIDNGSNDGSQEVVRKKYPEVHLIENDKNLGYARANNHALSKIDTPYAALINSDTVLTPGALKTIVKFMDERPDIGVCGAQLLNPDGTKQNSIANFPTIATELFFKRLLRRLFPERFPGKEVDIREPIEVETVLGACMVVRAKAIQEVGLLDEDFFFFFEETDWCKRMREKGWRVFYHPGSRAYHLQGGSANKVIIRARVEFWRSRYTLFRKHMGITERVVLRTGLLIRLTVTFAINLMYNILTFFTFTSEKRRFRLRLCFTLIGWHLAGCPPSWGIPRGCKTL